MSFIHKAIEWMGDHKFLTFLGAAGVGSLVVSRTVKAAEPLPGAKNVQQLPGGGLVSPVNVVPPLNVSDTPMQVLYVTTQDPAPYGNLNARANGDVLNGQPTGAIIGYWPKNERVELLDPGNGNGLVYIKGPGIDSNGNPTMLKAWGWLAFLKPGQ
jgi:hypothetical protein